MLISTIVGGVVQAIGAIAKNPLSIINTLAESLPKVCTTALDLRLYYSPFHIPGQYILYHLCDASST